MGVRVNLSYHAGRLKSQVGTGVWNNPEKRKDSGGWMVDEKG